MDESPELRRIAREIFLGALSAEPGTMPPWVVDRMTALMVEEDVRADRTLFTEGDPVDSVAFMRSGRVRLLKDGRPSWVIEGRALLGSQELMLDRAHSRTAIALSDLHLLKLPADAWVELLEDSFELLRVAILHATHLVALLDEQLGDTAPGKQDSPVLELPTRPLSVIERLAVFVDLPLLSRAGVQTLVDLAIEAEEVRYEPGHVVLERGAPRDRGVLVLEGIVSATRDAPDLSRRFGPGSMVCGAAAFGPTSTAWRAVAITEVRALSITAESWFDLLEEHFDIAKSVLAGRALERERLLDQLATRDPGVVFAH